MEPEIEALLREYRKKRAFNAHDWVERKITMAVEYFRRTGISAAVISVSGGIDSSVVFALAKRIADIPDSPLKRLVAIAQPIHSTESIQGRAYAVGEALGHPVLTVDQSAVFDALHPLIESAMGIQGEHFALGQLRSYMRTPTQYFAAQLLSQVGTPAVVLGTGNYDEDGYLRYFCKAGDGVVDVALIADLHKSEVFAVGAELGLPRVVLDAAPSADLWPGQTDEDELGVSYAFVELLTGYWLQLSEEERKKTLAEMSEKAREQMTTWASRAESVHRRNAHKVGFPQQINVLSCPVYQ